MMRTLHCDLFPMNMLLFITEDEFYKFTKRLDASCFPEKATIYPAEGAAHTVAFTGVDVGLIILVTLGKMEDDEEAALILTHEAVHVKQFLFAEIGETNPGNETEAYFIEWVVEALLAERKYLINKAAKKAALLAKEDNLHVS